MEISEINFRNTCLHNHTIHSDGRYGPAELVRRAQVNGIKCLAITDHVDSSNLEMITAPAIRAAMELSEYWPIRVISGCEITHAPIEQFPDLVVRARERGVQLVVAHGETTTEPVLEGTNAAAIKAGVDILAHPGLISDEDLKLAVKNQVALELSLREKQFDGNVHLLNRIREHKLTESALILLNADSHTGEQIKSDSVVDFFINNCLGEYSEVERNVLMSRISASIQIVVSRCQGIV